MRAGRVAPLALLVGALLAGCGGSGSGPGSGSPDGSTAAAPHEQSSPRGLRLEVETMPHPLPDPISGEAVVPQGRHLLVVGGLDEADVSVATVTELDPATGKTRSAGELSQPLHDNAATAVATGVLAFGGGSTSTTDEVQRLIPGGAGEAVGRLPVPRSDLSAATIGGSAYVLAGFDGERTVGAILRTEEGSKLETVASLPVPVRYAAVAALGPTIYAIGGEETSGADSTAIQAFDTKTGRAAVVGHLAAPLAHASAVVLDDHLYVLGGRLNGSTTDQILRFDPVHGTANSAGHLPEPIQNAAAATLGGVGYLVGGLDPAETPLSSVIALKLTSPIGG